MKVTSQRRLHAFNGGPLKKEEHMATYRNIIERLRETHGFAAQTCWIADVKAAHGLTRGASPNRIDPDRKVKPCPPDKRAAIERALIHFGMV
jgi:hypothetical protein